MKQKRWTIAFAPLDEGMYQVTVRRSGSVHRFKAKLPPDISDLWKNEAKSAQTTRQFRSDIDTLAPEAQFFGAGNMPTLKEIGERIMDAILDVNNGREGIKVLGALEDRVADSGGVELQFDLSQTPELQGIPWEAAYLKSKDRFLAIGTSSNVVRRLDAQSELPDPIERPIRILVAAANPHKDLDTDVELGNIERRIGELVASGGDDFEVEALHATTREQFRTKVRDWKPHIIHYIGHSAFKDGAGYLYFETEEGDDDASDRVSAETLRTILLNMRPWVVVLNSCESGKTSLEHPMGGVAQDLLGRINIPFVVGMQQPVSDDAAIAFSQDFYCALTEGQTIANAVTLGRNAIATQADERTQIELITPALYTSGEADRIGFVEAGTAAATAAVVTAAGTDAEAQGWADKAADFIKKPTGILLAISAFVVALGTTTSALNDTWTTISEAFGGDDEATPKPGDGEQTSADEDRSGERSLTGPADDDDQAGGDDDPGYSAEGSSNPASGNVEQGRGLPEVVVPRSRELPAAPPPAPRRIPRVFTAPASGSESLVGESDPYLVGSTGAAAYSNDATPTYQAYTDPRVPPEVADQALTPPPLPVAVQAASTQITRLPSGEIVEVPLTWQQKMDILQVPYCDGVVDSVQFEFGDANPLKPDRDVRGLAAYWFDGCHLDGMDFIGYAEPEEDADRGLALARADRVATIFADKQNQLRLGLGFTSAPPKIAVEADAPPPDNRIVEIVYRPICPYEDSTYEGILYEGTVDAKIGFDVGQTELDDEALAQLSQLSEIIGGNNVARIVVTAAPDRFGEQIFADAQARVRSVLNALPNMEGRDASLVAPRLVSWGCSVLYQDAISAPTQAEQIPQDGALYVPLSPNTPVAGQDAQNYVTVEVLGIEEILNGALAEPDLGEQSDEPAIVPQGVE